MLEEKQVGNTQQENLHWISVEMPAFLNAFVLFCIFDTFCRFRRMNSLAFTLKKRKKEKKNKDVQKGKYAIFVAKLSKHTNAKRQRFLTKIWLYSGKLASSTVTHVQHKLFNPECC